MLHITVYRESLVPHFHFISEWDLLSVYCKKKSRKESLNTASKFLYPLFLTIQLCQVTHTFRRMRFSPHGQALAWSCIALHWSNLDLNAPWKILPRFSHPILTFVRFILPSLKNGRVHYWDNRTAGSHHFWIWHWPHLVMTEPIFLSLKAAWQLVAPHLYCSVMHNRASNIFQLLNDTLVNQPGCVAKMGRGGLHLSIVFWSVQPWLSTLLNKLRGFYKF